MHPVIKKFWEDYYRKELEDHDQFFSVKAEGGGCIIICLKYDAVMLLAGQKTELRPDATKFKEGDWVYPFRKVWRTEGEMLKIISMKAFL